MRPLARFAFLAAVLWQGAAAAEYFPAQGKYVAAGYTMAVSSRAEAIGRKVAETVAKNREWFADYIKQLNLKSGEVLPYHENLGVSREDYEFFLANGKKLNLAKYADVGVNVSSDANGIRLSLTGAEIPVAVYEFSLDGTELRCAYGTSREKLEINQTDRESVLGRWQGREWRIKIGEADPTTLADYLSFQIALGRDESGRNIVYLRAAGLKNKAPLNWSCVIRWPETPAK